MTLILKRYISPYKILPRLFLSFIWGLSKHIRVWRATTKQQQVASHLQTASLAKQTREEDLQEHIPESLLLKRVSKSSPCLNGFGRNTEIPTIFYYTGSRLKQAWGYTKHDHDWDLVGNQPTLIKGINAEAVIPWSRRKIHFSLGEKPLEENRYLPKHTPTKEGYFLLRGVCQLLNSHMCTST